MRHLRIVYCRLRRRVHERTVSKPGRAAVAAPTASWGFQSVTKEMFWFQKQKQNKKKDRKVNFGSCFRPGSLGPFFQSVIRSNKRVSLCNSGWAQSQGPPTPASQDRGRALEHGSQKVSQLMLIPWFNTLSLRGPCTSHVSVENWRQSLWLTSPKSLPRPLETGITQQGQPRI